MSHTVARKNCTSQTISANIIVSKYKYWKRKREIYFILKPLRDIYIWYMMSIFFRINGNWKLNNPAVCKLVHEREQSFRANDVCSAEQSFIKAGNKQLKGEQGTEFVSRCCHNSLAKYFTRFQKSVKVLVITYKSREIHCQSCYLQRRRKQQANFVRLRSVASLPNSVLQLEKIIKEGIQN